ncbi:VOC family protein [Microvirga tunisiensis]|uniref:VOC family protein n=1 Tax=Pannonibacter tanglangensis TaxID=2750084 RepID=A0A7X5J9U6_9HYPH|nr:VOC family protein [Pannonibacter sp. XCT-53]NBN80204.1 VOC family protein [Pannonibacter sp. XCT-53]
MEFYVTLGARDVALSHAFYDRVLATIGWSSHASFPGWRGYSAAGAGKGATVWICEPHDGAPATAGNGTMVAFPAASPAEVDAFYREAMALGAADEGAAGPRPHYGPDWYAAYLRDPTGNKIAVVFNG